MKTLDRLQPYVLSLLRIIVGLLFMQHGLSKLFGFPAGAGFPVFLSLPWFEGWIEMIGGGLIAVGLFTRLAALIASGEMAIGYFMVHAPKSFFPYVNGGATSRSFIASYSSTLYSPVQAQLASTRCCGIRRAVQHPSGPRCAIFASRIVALPAALIAALPSGLRSSPLAVDLGNRPKTFFPLAGNWPRLCDLNAVRTLRH
jgi:putative oxidoreductase